MKSSTDIVQCGTTRKRRHIFLLLKPSVSVYTERTICIFREKICIFMSFKGTHLLGIILSKNYKLMKYDSIYMVQ